MYLARKAGLRLAEIGADAIRAVSGGGDGHWRCKGGVLLWGRKKKCWMTWGRDGDEERTWWRDRDEGEVGMRESS